MAVIETMGSPALWGAFGALVLVMLALDLGVFHRKAHVVKPVEALAWTAVWVGLAAAWSAGIWAFAGQEKALEFATAYVIEKALSVDNVFVFLIIFASLRVPAERQHRVLFWGILGALVLRAIFVAGGALLVSRFHWVMYVFGAILCVTGLKLLLQREHEPEPEKNLLVRLFRSLVPVSERDGDGAFVVREAGRLRATPLLLALVAVEGTDVVFAVDSIPAVFAVSQDPFIVYTSNIFAILGLRSLFFLLSGALASLRFLKVGLALVLLFVGGKMLIVDIAKVPTGMSLGVIAGLLGACVAASLRWPAPAGPRVVVELGVVPAGPPAPAQGAAL